VLIEFPEGHVPAARVAADWSRDVGCARDRECLNEWCETAEAVVDAVDSAPVEAVVFAHDPAHPDAKLVLAIYRLIAGSTWFAVEPRPDGAWAVYVKNEPAALRLARGKP
jgi:hypothetical protein